MMTWGAYFIAGAIILLAAVFPAMMMNAEGGSASETHDVGVVTCIKQGPGPINLSDSGGAYMYMQCEITNFSSHDEMVSIADPSNILSAQIPPGCWASTVLVVPGSTAFVIRAGDMSSDSPELSKPAWLADRLMLLI